MSPEVKHFGHLHGCRHSLPMVSWGLLMSWLMVKSLLLLDKGNVGKGCPSTGSSLKQAGAKVLMTEIVVEIFRTCCITSL
ncbi:hypothetical protein MKW98_032206 [Papaver atlanticum]|uniref:Uncharacterized protein n=1 Tax=Papaver atlanticum TaxID=357466 RepID=A0AAD4SFY4_9MAGN|nr:hypothetical protein MKW98_032206 [Papaver atlanticum]